MSEQKHTPGPWTKGDGPIIYDDNAKEVCLIHDAVNINLICAAPDLLEALKSLVNGVDLEEADKYLKGLIEEAEKAIKKATEQP